MVATNLAAAFAASGKRVGLLDADIYGPNIPLMFGAEGRPGVSGTKGQQMIQPMEAHGVRLMSIGFLLEKEQPAIMRGPLISGILKQFLEQVTWGDLDVMVVDMPPGTGDAQLSLVQIVDVDGVVMVTTPQDVATGDVRRGIKMFEKVNTSVLGIVENMSGFMCPHCDEEIEVFGSGGGGAPRRGNGTPLPGACALGSGCAVGWGRRRADGPVRARLRRREGLTGNRGSCGGDGGGGLGTDRLRPGQPLNPLPASGGLLPRGSQNPYACRSPSGPPTRPAGRVRP